MPPQVPHGLETVCNLTHRRRLPYHRTVSGMPCLFSTALILAPHPFLSNRSSFGCFSTHFPARPPTPSRPWNWRWILRLAFEIAGKAVSYDGFDRSETLLTTYLDPHFMFSALFSDAFGDLTDEQFEQFMALPPMVLEDLVMGSIW
jgi:hypothetical protein